MQGLARRFGEREAVRGISLEIREGETNAIQAPSSLTETEDNLNHQPSVQLTPSALSVSIDPRPDAASQPASCHRCIELEPNGSVFVLT